jgi:hypothetical protein
LRYGSTVDKESATVVTRGLGACRDVADRPQALLVHVVAADVQADAMLLGDAEEVSS